MASSGFNSDYPVRRIGDVLVDEIRTAAAAGSEETTFEHETHRKTSSEESEKIFDLEERVRRLVIHHLNDTGVPISAKRPQTVEASPEFAFLLRGAATAVKALPAVYKGVMGLWHAHQDRRIRSFYRTAVISIDLKNATEYLLAVVSGLPLLQQSIFEDFPGINLHLRVLWQLTVRDQNTGQTRGNGATGSLTITKGCIDRSAIMRLLKLLQKNPNQNLVVLRGWRWMSVIKLTRTWVLPQEHPWAAARNNLTLSSSPRPTE